jgi:diguanylate cyclase (GGDEF)-like protein
MARLLDRRQVMVAAADTERTELKQTLDGPLADDWEVLEADSLERVRFLLQHRSCHMVVVDESLHPQDGAASLGWLVRAAKAPVVYLTNGAPESAVAALGEGVAQWMPRDLAIRQPRLLDAVLRRADQTAALDARCNRFVDELAESRRQANRLLALLWETSTGEARNRFLSQRQMMERFQEEVARTERHGSPLAVVLGEIQCDAATSPRDESQALLENWTAEQISRAKRRADVAGQYGPHGFMVLLVQTSEHGATSFCRRLRSLLEQSPGTSGGPPICCRAHFGVAGYGSATFNSRLILSRAEELLDQSKLALVPTAQS